MQAKTSLPSLRNAHKAEGAFAAVPKAPKKLATMVTKLSGHSESRVTPCLPQFPTLLSESSFTLLLLLRWLLACEAEACFVFVCCTAAAARPGQSSYGAWPWRHQRPDRSDSLVCSAKALDRPTDATHALALLCSGQIGFVAFYKDYLVLSRTFIKTLTPLL